MKKKTHQDIEDFYKNQGYSGDAFRKILEKDNEWLRLVGERRKKLAKQIQLSETEKKKYVMSTDKDYEILLKVRKLEGKKLAKHDKIMIELIKTQLEHDWREYLIKAVDRMLRKYKEQACR